MVITRRTPVVAQPPLAHNPSSRGTQRPPRSSTNDIAGVSKNPDPSMAVTSLASSPGSDKDHHNGLDNSSEKKTKKSRRRAKSKRQKSNFQAFLDFLTKLLLFAFTIYTFSVCPQDTRQQSPICRGLSEYKRIVLDPYIIPPLQAALIHPSVSPYIERAKPYAHRIVEITTPVLLRTQQEWNLHVAPQWEGRIVPEWNKRVVTQWNKYVIPQWDKHVAPRIQLVQSRVEPYRLRVSQEYEQRIVPQAQVALYNLQRWQRQAEPYILMAASKTKNGYYTAKPYAVPLARKFGHLLQQSAFFLQELRQKFVDPHVAKIWEKVKELSSGQAIRGATPKRESPTSEAVFTILEAQGYETTVSSTRSLIPTYDDAIPTLKGTDVADISIGVSKTIEDEPLSTSAEPGFAPKPESVTSEQLPDIPAGAEPFPTPEPVLARSSQEPEPSIAVATIGLVEPDAMSSASSAAATASSSSILPQPSSESEVYDPTPFVTEHDGATSFVSFAAATVSPPRARPTAEEHAEPPTPVTSSKIPAAGASATVISPVNLRADEEIDLDAFYAELGLDEPLGNPSVSEEDNLASPSQPIETEEEMAERHRLKAEEMARRRADIEARQAKWETELEAQMERGTSQLQNRLSHLRVMAAAELASSAEVRNSIEELVYEAEKYIKGGEIYLKNLKGENRRSDEKMGLWERVADRVNDKFIERLSATQKVVNDWYGGVLDKELQEVAIVVDGVREVAEKGQLDLGLDYAWLEDVTYNDWQRYHALIATSERYTQEAASIQNGTHPKVVVANPMASIFADLESEVQDVVIGFETRLRRIKRDGERAFNNYGNGNTQKEEEKGSIVEPDPEVSIPTAPHGLQGSVIIGRSQEEVLGALGKVEPVGETGNAMSGSNVNANEAVSRLVLEMEGGAQNDRSEL